MSQRPSPDQTLRANKEIHSHLASSGEYNQSPHFLPENRAAVRAVLEGLVKTLAGRHALRAIDFGCGTGFIIDLVKDLVHRVDGVDITPEMMQQVNTESGNVFLHECVAEDTPFPSNSFHLATAYSFMDHLYDHRKFLSEAYRVLSDGGIFYADLNPNRSFIKALSKLEADSRFDIGSYPLISREIMGALRNGLHYNAAFGLDATRLEQAEPGKTFDLGFDATEVCEYAREIGFSRVSVEYQWFLGQGKVIHDRAIPGLSDQMAEHLQSILPLTNHLFKYLRFVFIK